MVSNADRMRGSMELWPDTSVCHRGRTCIPSARETVDRHDSTTTESSGSTHVLLLSAHTIMQSWESYRLHVNVLCCLPYRHQTHERFSGSVRTTPDLRGSVDL
jgi:hypothetical protein